MIRTCDKGHASLDAANWRCPWCEIERLRSRVAELTDKALRYDLDQAGIDARDREAVELVDLRARVVELKAHLKVAFDAWILGARQGSAIRGEARRSIAALRARIAELEADCERERIRLAACGVIANANTQETAAKAREMLPEYRSASADDVSAAVDREMALRARVAGLEKQIQRMLDAAVDAAMREEQE